MPLALCAAAAVAVLIGLSAGICAAQDQGGAAAAPASNQPAFIKNLHITGFFQNTTSTWVNPNAIEYNLHSPGEHPIGTPPQNLNALAAERQLLQVDINDDFTENDSMFMRAWFVYEPSYPWETDCAQQYGNLAPGVPFGPTEIGIGPNGHCNSDFYNQYGIRELWFKHRWGPLQFFVGRQIVTWGESLAFRVGDQINPVDNSWAFGFSNLEQSRVPVWMIHPILNLPSVGPFSSNFAELVYIPGFDFLYTDVDYSNDQYNGMNNIAGRVNVNAESPGGRFGVRLDSVGPGAHTLDGVFVAPPFVMLQYGAPGCTTAFTTGCVYVTVGRNNPQVIPSATWGNSQIGFRLHTLVQNAEITAFYLWNHDYGSVARIRTADAFTLVPGTATLPGVALRRIDSFYPQYQSLGVTLNRPIYLPGALAQLPFVIRAETFYKNHDAFNTLAVPGTIFSILRAPLSGGGIGQRNWAPDGTTRSDTIQWLFALDLDQAYTPWLTTTGNLTANYELTDTTILSYSKFMQGAGGFFSRAYHNNVEMLFSIGTSWWWGAISPNWTTIYAPEGLTFLSFPSVQLTPPWTNKYFMKVEWVDIQGTDQYGLNGGVFKGKDMIFAQFQYNFSLM
jgi:hypothetical protein